MTGAPTLSVAAPVHAPGHFDRLFYTGMAIVIALVVVVGFAPTYYVRPRAPEPLPLYIHLHGLVFSAWIVLLLTQTILVAAKRTPVHQKVGWIGAGLAAVMVVVGVTTGILSGRGNVDAGFDDEARAFLTVPLLSMVVLSTLVAAAIEFRRQPQTHKRLMLLATISLLDAPIARWPGAPGHITGVYVAADLFIVALVLYDLASRRRVDPACLWGGLLIVAGQILREVVGPTRAWQTIARALIG